MTPVSFNISIKYLINARVVCQLPWRDLMEMDLLIARLKEYESLVNQIPDFKSKYRSYAAYIHDSISYFTNRPISLIAKLSPINRRIISDIEEMKKQLNQCS